MASEQITENSTSYRALSPHDLFAAIWHHKWSFALCLVATTAVGSIYLVRAQPVYEVKSRLLVEKQAPPLSGKEPQRPEKDQSFLATQAEIISSPTVVARAAELCGWSLPQSGRARSASAMVDQLSVRPVMGTNVLTVSFQSSSGTEAVTGMDAIITSYREYLNDSERTSRGENLELLTRSEKELRTDQRNLESQYVALRKRSPFIGTGKQGTDVQLAMVEQLARKLGDLRNQRVELENQLQLAVRPRTNEALTNAKRVAPPIVFTSYPPGVAESEGALDAANDALIGRYEVASIASTILPSADMAEALDIGGLQKQLLTAQMREKELMQRFGDKHPEIRAVREQIAALNVELREAVESVPGLVRQELETVQANETRTAELYASELDKAKATDAYVVEEQQLTGQIESVRSLHDSVHAQLREWELTNQAVANGRCMVKVTVLDPPIQPAQPIWPSPVVLFGTCAVVGLVMGAGWTTLAEQRRLNVPRTSR